jgi:HSP20 family protein
LGELQEQMNALFNRFWHTGLSTRPLDGQDWAPAVDVREEPDCYVVTAEVPGLRVEDIEVTYSGNTLTLSGQKTDALGEEPGEGWLFRERRFGQFSRSVSLPEGAKEDAISATCSMGVLTVKLPKLEESKPKVIHVNVEE